MTELAPELWAGLVAISLMAGIVKGVVGFAMPMVMISGFGSFVAPDLALAFLIIPTLVANGAQAFRNGLQAALASIRVHWRFIAILLLFLATSAQLVRYLPAQVYLLVLGVPVTLFAIAQLLGWRLRFADSARRLAELVIGSIAGFIFHLLEINHRLPAGPLQRIC